MHHARARDVYFNYNGDYSGLIRVTPTPAEDEIEKSLRGVRDLQARRVIHDMAQASAAARRVEVPFSDLVAVALGSDGVAVLTHAENGDPDAKGRTLQITRSDAQHLVAEAESMRLTSELEKADDDFFIASVRKRVEAAGTTDLEW